MRTISAHDIHTGDCEDRERIEHISIKNTEFRPGRKVLKMKTTRIKRDIRDLIHRMNIQAEAGKQSLYEIRVRGKLDEGWSEFFENISITFEVRRDGSMMTVLSGPITDQSALYGLLIRIHDLNLTLLSVKRVEQE
jgi:hypothetical protein